MDSSCISDIQPFCHGNSVEGVASFFNLADEATWYPHGRKKNLATSQYEWKLNLNDLWNLKRES